MRTKILIPALVLAAVLLAPVGNVEACGPWFEPEVFVDATVPDDLAAFAAGHLGIIQAGYDSNEYAVAYRYLNGGKLSASELSAYASPPLPPQQQPDWSKMSPDQIAEAAKAQQLAEESARPYGRWMLARDQYAPSPSPPSSAQPAPPENSGNLVIDNNYLNCPDPAFTNAAITVNNRAGVWGAHSPWLADWIHAQDAVFSNCDGKTAATPASAPADSPALLKADRAYQLASAAFYRKQFDDAARQFAAIAADNNSPWQPWGTYLAARATVRKAFSMGKATDPYSGDLATYDPATMLRAQQMLEALLTQRSPMPSRATILAELNFIRIRTEPETRATEISAALAGPDADANFSQDLVDLSWLLENHAIKNQPPLVAWIAAWRSGDSASVFATWQQSHAVPWFTVAMAKASPSDPFVPQLLDEAAKTEPGSPAYDTVFYHRVRLLIDLKRSDEARNLLDKALAAPNLQKPGSERNALLAERLSVARDFNEFLQFAPRKVLFSGSAGDGDLAEKCLGSGHASNAEIAQCRQLETGLWFDQDAAQFVNQQIPLQLLIQAARKESLPENLRQSLAIVAWTRSVLLEDAKSAATIAPLLPKTLQGAVGSSIGFPADLAMLRNPGIRPYLEAGVPRVASYSFFDDFRNNWWSDRWTDPDAEEQTKPIQLPAPSFLSPAELAQAAAESQHLHQDPGDFSVICQRVINYAKQHPDVPQIPEALALIVRATHYSTQTWESGASGHEFTPVSKAAFNLLHQHYPKSPWTAKTPYYY
jgi:hypothetical protein